LAINVSIPNPTVARLEQFRSPQLQNPERATNGLLPAARADPTQPAVRTISSYRGMDASF